MTRFFFLLSLAALCGLNASAQNEIVPFVECVERPIPLDLGSSILPYYQVYFGFFNTSTAQQVFPAGNFRNQVIPGAASRGQQSAFPSGVGRRVFSVFTSSAQLTYWVLNQSVAIAGDNPGQYCPEPDMTPFLVVGAPLKLVNGNSYVGLEVAKMLTAAPLTAIPALDAKVYARSPNASSPVLSSDLAVRNLRLEGALVKADVDVAPVPSVQNHALALTVSLNGQPVASKSLLVQTLTGCPLVFSPGALPAAAQNVLYPAVGFSATGDAAPYTFELTAGTLPVGMQLTAGSLRGTPTETGTFPLTIAATSATNCLAQATYTLTVMGPSCSADVTSQIALTLGGFRQNLVSGRWQQTVTVRNAGLSPINAPAALALENLSANATLYNAIGRTQCSAPLGRPYVLVNTGADSILSPAETISVALEFTNTTPGQAITYTPRIVAGGQQQ